jgi:hypothetical protein
MDKEAPDWGPEAVLRRLQATVESPEMPVEAQLFLNEGVAPEDIETIVQKALATAADDLGLSQGSISLGKVRSLSHSISATAPLAVLREVMARKEFASLLPGDLTSDEAMIKPVKRSDQ